MAFKDWFKRKVEIQYIPSQPAYQALGYIEGSIYFISSYSGKIYKISKDRIRETEMVSQIMQIHD